MERKKIKLRLTKQAIRELTDVMLPDVKGGNVQPDGHAIGTNHCASGKASGCAKGCVA